MPSKRFYCHDHQGKASAYIQALISAGYIRVGAKEKERGRFMLTDIDIMSRQVEITEYADTGRKVFLYPHTGRPQLIYDMGYPHNKGVTAIFTTGDAGRDVLQAFNFKGAPIHPVGWTYCEIQPFEPCEKPRKVLFMPIHVNGNGYMVNRLRVYNARTYHRLLSLPDVELTVRYLHGLEDNGLWFENGVDYVIGKPDQSTTEIDAADVVVGHQNAAYLAVARGKPTLMMAESETPVSGTSPDNINEAESWDKYKHLMIYPHDILAEGDTMELMIAAGKESEAVSEWRDRVIGKPFDAELFIDTLEDCLNAR